MAFMPAALDTLVKDIHERHNNNYPFKYVRQSHICCDDLGNFDQNRFDILISGKVNNALLKYVLQFNKSHLNFFYSSLFCHMMQ